MSSDELLFHDCDPETLDWALADSAPSTYILASLDRTIRPGWQRRARASIIRV